MHSIASSRDARRLFVSSIVARLPLVMLSMGLLVHARHAADPPHATVQRLPIDLLTPWSAPGRVLRAGACGRARES